MKLTNLAAAAALALAAFRRGLLGVDGQGAGEGQGDHAKGRVHRILSVDWLVSWNPTGGHPLLSGKTRPSWQGCATE